MSSWTGMLSHMSSNQGAAMDDLEQSHKKRLAMILRYIATMHHSADNQKGISFVHDGDPHQQRREDILFTTPDFRHVMALDPDGTLFASPPFSFYAASPGSSSESSRKRMFTGASKNTLLSKRQATDGRPCWLRLTRVAPEVSPRLTQGIKQYLLSWKASSQPGTTLSDLLTLQSLANAPRVASGQEAHEIKSFLRQYKRFLKRKRMRTSLEPFYNRLFEWLQEQGSRELVWGFGNACRHLDGGTCVQGPLLEVLVEVELAKDGALLVRPRPHTGVALNREVTSALTMSGTRDILSNFHRTVADLDTSQLSPGQPSSYASLLKQAAVELSPGGSFVSSSNGSLPEDRSKLVVTDAWILFSRPKPSSVWARDASALAECVLSSSVQLPPAAWSLTHGPAALEAARASIARAESSGGILTKIKNALLGRNSSGVNQAPTTKPLLPLPTSEAQNRIANMLMVNNAPAVVCEGPPGTGKTHTIANIVCAYLCQGRRVLVTSKGAPALSVLRERLPKCVQELCVDVSLSESTGMRQLQQTVERLADRVSGISLEVQQEQCELLQRSIKQLEAESMDIDNKLKAHSERNRKVVQSTAGQELIERALSLLESVPWMMRTAATFTVAETNILAGRVGSLFCQATESDGRIAGFSSPPSKALVSLVATKAGKSAAFVRTATAQAIAAIPLLGNSTKELQIQAQQTIEELRLDGTAPSSRSDWGAVLSALQHDLSMHEFHVDVVEPLIVRHGWLEVDIYDQTAEKRRFQKGFVDNLSEVSRLKGLCRKRNVSEEIEQAVAARQLDARRSRITLTLQRLAEDLVDATVVTSLSRMFTPEAQSALIRFAQISGKAKFSRSSQAARMTQRQLRHRQEYLDAFEKCVRYIPCWILTSSQISDYLPAEFGLFDLVIIDEASQSDITALPGILRGKQWLIVGDGKQVSPSESFISETQIDSLQAALPESPLEDGLLPGHSFFDLCAQAFPGGRVVLGEHFRCAPEIIDFSNRQFYNGRLVPLRLPTSCERLSPSIVDVKVQNASKVGKVNEKECDTIVAMVLDFVKKSASEFFPRTIGIVSLVGDEQSRLIRGRLLDSIGPQKYKEHAILVGDAPTFQGAERDIIFLSMVCSPGAVPAQGQLMHAQRANVALSRARDRMVLVRSIDANHISSQDDIKLPILDFFACHDKNCDTLPHSEPEDMNGKSDGGIVSFRCQTEQLLEEMLRSRGYAVRRMGIVWHNAICVENVASGQRAAVCVDGAGESTEHWMRLVGQQKSIERVGWKSIRVDALTFLVDFATTLQFVEDFLSKSGVEPEPTVNGEVVYDEIEIDDEVEVEMIDAEETSVNQEVLDADREHVVDHDVVDADIVFVSSDEGDRLTDDRRVRAETKVEVKTELEDDGIDPSAFGDVVDLAFLRGSSGDNYDVELEDPYDPSSDSRRPRFQRGATSEEEYSSGMQYRELNDDNEGNGVARLQNGSERDKYFAESESEESGDVYRRPRKRRRRTRRRLDIYARDPRWYPGRTPLESVDDENEWHDTDSDLPGRHDTDHDKSRNDADDVDGHEEDTGSLSQRGTEKHVEQTV